MIMHIRMYVYMYVCMYVDQENLDPMHNLKENYHPNLTQHNYRGMYIYMY